MPTIDKRIFDKYTLDNYSLDKYKLDANVLDGLSTNIGGIDSYTKIMLHMNGTNSSVTFTDNSLSPKTFTPNGNAQINTSQSMFGGASGLFDGSGDWVETPAHSDFNLGASDFTIDFWLKRNALGVLTMICGQSDSSQTNTTLSFKIYINASNQLALIIGTGATIKTYVSGYISDSNWHHIALVRYGNTIKFYIDGVNNGYLDVTGVTINNSSYKLSIGRNGEFASQYFNGCIEEFRFSNGIARWTTDFTPPSSEYTT